MTTSCVLGLYLVAAACFGLGGFVGINIAFVYVRMTLKNSP